jgi:DUF4097 and DUF4098 domain-containing protein YvlB
MFKRIFSSIPGLIVIASFAAAAMKLPAFARSERLEFSDHMVHNKRGQGVVVRRNSSAKHNIHRGFAAKGGEVLEVDLKTGGEIEVSGWDKDSIDVRATLEHTDCSDARVSFDETHDGMRIAVGEQTRGRGRNNSCDADFEIMVPKRHNVKVSTMGGDIRLTGLQGQFSGRTMGGELDLSNLKGDLSLTTMGGDITLTKSEVDGSVKTMGGKVLLEDVIGGVKGESMGGNVVYRRVTNKKGEGSGNEVRIKTMGGDINVDDAPDGADVHTMGGKIRIASASKFVKALTMGGEIEVEEIDGSVSATTMGGDIDVTMIGDPKRGDRSVSLKSHGGDITLVVPEGLSMDVDIELSYTRGHEEDYEIISDFPLKERVSPDWIRDKGDPRKIISGTGLIGGGKHKVRIETINGNVYLKKGKAN